MSNELARLLAHPLRARLLYEYERPQSPAQLARRLQQRVNLVSYHTNVLHERGWIELVGTRPRRGATEHFYRSVGPVYIEDDEWEQVAPSLRRAVTLDTLRITSEEAKAAAFAGGFDDATAHLSRTVLELDARGVTDLAAKLRDVMRDVEKIAAAARERSRDGRERHEVVIQYFRVPPTD